MSFEKNVDKAAAKLQRIGVMPVLALNSVEEGLKMAELLDRGGLKAAEVTFRTSAAPEVISEIVSRYPDLCVGAGTILNVEDLHRAFDAGAAFAVAPGGNPEVIREAVACGHAFFPGVATPTDVERAMALGCRILKFFPAEAAGGIPMLKSLIGPYKHTGVRFLPTGGVTASNVRDYLGIPEVLAVGGTWLGKAADIARGEWDRIGHLIEEAVGLVHGPCDGRQDVESNNA